MKKTPFRYKTHISIGDTDATGVLYVPQLFHLATRGFEHFLKAKQMSLATLFDHYLFPVVHAEGDYFKPLRISDDIEIEVQVEKIQNTSFIMKYLVYKEGELASSVRNVHVAVDKDTWTKIPVPKEIHSWL